MALSDCEETIYFMQMTQAQIENFTDSAFYNKGEIIEIITNRDNKLYCKQIFDNPLGLE